MIDRTLKLRPSLRLAVLLFVAGLLTLAISRAPGDADAAFSSSILSSSQFNSMFPSRNSFYTYSNFVNASNKFTAFGTYGTTTIKKREIAAFLANVAHETGGLVHIRETNTAYYGNYCDWSQSYGCPAGQRAYYGRGPIQLSWNYNYNGAGKAIGNDLLRYPDRVATNGLITWQAAIWFWMTQRGASAYTPHNAMVQSKGFGQTIRAINSMECGQPVGSYGYNTMMSRINYYKSFSSKIGIGTNYGGGLTC